MKDRKEKRRLKKEEKERKRWLKTLRPESPLVHFLNRYSLIFHVFLACGVCFVIEWVSRHSFLDACSFVVDRNLVFLYNSLLVFASLLFVYIFRRRAVARLFISVFWLFLGIINGCVLAKRVTPFSFTDLKMVSDLFTMQSNYFSEEEAILVIAAVAAVIVFLVVFWFKGPKYKGKTHRLAGGALAVAVLMMIPNVTNAAVSNNILTEYFENIAQGYRDYGFVYSFSASVLDRGMSEPEEYSQESVNAVLEQMQAAEESREQQVSADADSQEAEEGLTVQMVCAPTEGGSSRGTGSASLIKNTRVQTASGETEISEASSDETEIREASLNEQEAAEEAPNIICVLLESFVDPEQINFLELSEDPVPYFRYLSENYSTGYLDVPVVGAGTANTEFEVLTGMGMQFFGLGEYPYKTILKETNCESIASDLSELGYGTHVVHNNGANFYSRMNAFSMMGFDTFTSKEMMDIREYTPLGTWPTDDILIGEVEKALDYTPDQPDFVYTITVQTHGDYPTEKVLEDPAIQVSGAESEGKNYAWEYYVNMLHEEDQFIENLIDMLSQRDEKTIVVLFGDHLPTMGLTEEDMATGSLFLTQYITWDNFGLEREEKDLTSYQLLAEILDRLGIHTGTMFTYHQNRDSYGSEEEYQKGMELLQYDILYGEHYVYNGENPYPASDLEMGTQDVVVDQVYETDEYYYLLGDNFTRWSRIYIDGEKISTSCLSSKMLRFKKNKMKEGINHIVVQQMGSSNTVLRTSNEILYYRGTENE